MIIFFDLGTVLIAIVFMCIIIGGGITAVVSYIMAHLATVTLIMIGVGIVVGLIAAFLSDNIWVVFPFAVSFPPTALFPLIIGVPLLHKYFEQGIFTGFFYTLFMIIPFLIGWGLMFLLGPVASVGISEAFYENWDHSRMTKILSTLIGGFACTGIQYLLLRFIYNWWVL